MFTAIRVNGTFHAVPVTHPSVAANQEDPLIVSSDLELCQQEAAWMNDVEATEDGGEHISPHTGTTYLLEPASV